MVSVLHLYVAHLQILINQKRQHIGTANVSIEPFNKKLTVEQMGQLFQDQSRHENLKPRIQKNQRKVFSVWQHQDKTKGNRKYTLHLNDTVDFSR